MAKDITFSKDTKQETGPSIKFADPKSEISEILKRYDKQTNLILGIFIVAFITMVIMVGTLITDSFHINSATYKEYSEKIDERDQIIQTNKILIDQNKSLQQVLENQNEIMNLSKR